MSTNVSSVVSHFPDAENGFTTTTAGSVASGATTVALNSVAGYTNGEPAVFVIEPTSASAKQTFTGIVDTAGVQITDVVWTAGTNQTHALGVTVVDYATATHIAMISKGVKVEHAQEGTHTNITQADANYIKDDAGNELLKWSKTASAVNEVTIKNAATGTAPTIKASGGDSAVNLNLQGKGLAKTVTIGAGATVIFPYDYVVSGCEWTADAAGSTLAASMTAGVVVINGNPITVAAVTARTFTASKDVYQGFSDNGDGTALIVYYDNTTNAASPSLATAGYTVLNAIIVVGAGSIAAAASINQGQEDRVLPIASSIPYAVTDSLGNLICPRDPNRKILGYKRLVSTFSSGTTAETLVTGLNMPMIAPSSPRKVIIKFAALPTVSGSSGTAIVAIYDGVFGSGGTKIGSLNITSTNSGGIVEAITTLAASSSHTFTFTVASTAGNPSVAAAATTPAYVSAELV
jgi:hypothetical protein